MSVSDLYRDLEPYLGSMAGGSVIVAAGTGTTEEHDHDDLLPLDGSLGMLGSLNMGGYSIVNVDLVDGVDLGAWGADLSAIEADIALLNNRTVLGGAGLTSDEVLFGNGSPTLSANVGDGLVISADDIVVDLGFDFDWTGEHTFADQLSSPSFASGWTGHGWRLRTSDASMEVNDLTVRGTMSVYELLIRKIRATNGSVFVSSAGKVASVSGSGPYSITTEEDHGFAVGDLIRAQTFSGNNIWQSNMQVTAVADAENFTATLFSGTAPAAGMEFVRLGNVSDADRQGGIYLTSDDSDAPFIDIYNGVDSFSDWGTAGIHKARLGNLDGVTDPDMGALSGYGLYSDSVYLTGTMIGGSGAAVINEYGLTLQSRLDGISKFRDEIDWSTDPIDPNSGVTVARAYGERWSLGSEVYNTLQLRTSSTAESADQAEIELWAVTDGLQHGSIQIHTGAEDRVLISSRGPSSEGGEIFLTAGEVVYFGDAIRPYSDSYTDLGTSSKRFKRLFVDEIVAGTISSTDTGHNHYDSHYTKNEIDAFLSGKANTSHSHAGLVTAITFEAHTDDDTIHRTIDDSSSSGVALWSASKISTELTGLVATFANVNHSHDLDDLDERNYSSLTNRAHVIADASALGADHTIAGAADGYVLRATSPTTARMMQLDHDDLANVGASDHHAPLSTTDPNLVLNNQALSLGGDVALADVDNEFSTSQSIAGSLAATTNVTAGYDMIANRYAQIGERMIVGSIETPDSTIELEIRGETVTDGLTADTIDARKLQVTDAIFEFQSTMVAPNATLWTRRGGTVTSAATTIDSSGSITVAVEKHYTGYKQHAVGDTIRMVGYATSTITPATSGSAIFPRLFWNILPAIQIATEGDVWLEITDISDESTHFDYTCGWLHGNDHILFPAGSGIIGYGNASNDDRLGTMAIITDDNGPRMLATTYGENAWDQTPVLVAGIVGAEIDWLDRDEAGLVGGSNLDSEDDLVGFAFTDNKAILGNTTLRQRTNGRTTVRLAEDGAHFGLHKTPIGEDEESDWSELFGPGGYLGEEGSADIGYITFSDDADEWDSDFTNVYAAIAAGVADVGGNEASKMSMWVHAKEGQSTMILEATTDDSGWGNLNGNEPARIYLYTPSPVSSGGVHLSANRVTARAKYVELNATERIYLGQDYGEDTTHVSIRNLPTTTTGLPIGALWNDGGTVKVVT